MFMHSHGCRKGDIKYMVYRGKDQSQPACRVPSSSRPPSLF